MTKGRLQKVLNVLGWLTQLFAIPLKTGRTLLLVAPKIAKKLGYKEVPVVYLNIPDIEREK